jgi:hypothetical protein
MTSTQVFAGTRSTGTQPLPCLQVMTGQGYTRTNAPRLQVSHVGNLAIDQTNRFH